MTLTVRLLLLVALAVLPALLIGAYNEYALRQSREVEIKAEGLRLADQSRRELQQIIEGVQRLAATLAQIPTIQEAAAGTAAPQACADLLARLRREYPGQVEIGVASREGQVICTSRGLINYGRVAGSHPRRAMESGQFVVGGYGAARSDSFLSFAYPLRDQAGAMVGTILPGLNLAWLNEHMRQRFAAHEAVLALSDRDLTYLLRLPTDELGLVGKVAPPQGRGFVAMEGKGAFEVTGIDRVRRIAVVEALRFSPDSQNQPDLFLALGLSRDAAFEAIDASSRHVLVLLGLSLLLALAAAVIGGRYFVSRPVADLLAAAARWREGDYRQRATIPGGGEFARLGHAFNSMAEQIDRRETELRASEERFRSLASLVPAFIWFADEKGNLHYMNDRWYAFTGQDPSEALPHGWATALHPDDRERTLVTWQSAIAQGSVYEIEMRYRGAEGDFRWFIARAEPMRDEAGAITGWFGSSTDIHDIKEAEQHRTTLIHELNHRVKNTLTTVQSLATNSLRSGATEEARGALEGRILALSKTHDVLTRENWGGAELQEVAEEVVRPYRQAGDERFEIGGPVLRLTPGMALSLSMALHELCTNAVKYGALSNTPGRVSITWTVASSTAGAVLRLFWQESGGPPVVEPRDKGFGTRLLERGIARELGGTVEIRYAPAGLVCIIEAPMPILAAESDQPLEAA